MKTSFLAILIGYSISLAVMWGTFSYNPDDTSAVLFIPALLLVIAVVSLFVSFMCVRMLNNSTLSFFASITLNNLITVLGVAIYTQIYDGADGFNGMLIISIVAILLAVFPIALSSWIAAIIWKKNVAAKKNAAAE